MKIGFSIIGRERDRRTEKPGRWNDFRPSVGFGTQQDIPFERLILAFQHEDQALCDFIANDIRSKRKEHKCPPMSVDCVPITFKDPYDYGTCYRVMAEMLRTILADKHDDQVYLHVNTGTHTMQFAMYVLADQQMMPVKLIQVYPGTADAHNTTGSYARVIDLQWVNYPAIEADHQRKRSDVYDSFVLVPTKNEQFTRDLQQIARVAIETDEPILLLGETGTGKTRIARAIHEAWCTRHNGKYDSAMDSPPFKDLNCACLNNPQMAQSLLFGHKKGSFTGAIADHKGFVEEADGGTLFLDEIGDLDAETQAILLTTIETGLFRPLGDTQRKNSKFRLVCATNRQLEREVAKGTFRSDLFARIRSWMCRLPPLRDRHDDIAENIQHELSQWCEAKKDERRSRVTFGASALRAYLDFAESPAARWTGNFRDLSQSVRRMATMASVDALSAATTIAKSIVDEEIKCLKALWAEATPHQAISDDELFDALCDRVRSAEPQRNLVDAIEVFLLQQARNRMAENKARVARFLYEQPGKPLGNASSKYSERERFLQNFSKG
ncbi:MAG: RNA repair transcriptional activator RtcR family protein [bacterium]|nr:RNA repair transcriptional activator RtcR family protein [bacterium]